MDKPEGMLFKLCAIDDHEHCGGGDEQTFCDCDCHRPEKWEPTDQELEAMRLALEKR